MVFCSVAKWSDEFWADRIPIHSNIGLDAYDYSA